MAPIQRSIVAGSAARFGLPGRSGIAARIIRLLADKGSAIYPAADRLAYKLKWGPDLIQPEDAAFEGGISPRAVLSLLRVTNVA